MNEAVLETVMLLGMGTEEKRLRTIEIFLTIARVAPSQPLTIAGHPDARVRIFAAQATPVQIPIKRYSRTPKSLPPSRTQWNHPATICASHHSSCIDFQAQDL